MKRNTFKKITAVLLSVALLFSLCFAVLSIYSGGIDYSIDEALFDAAKGSNVTKIYYDESGKASSISEYEPKLYEELCASETRKVWARYDDISDSVKNGFVAMEDREFFSHSGVNLKRTFAATLNYIFHFGSNFGGSTITQQVIKNISGDNERTARRKINEIFRALHIEYSHSKTEILEVYMNIVDMGEGVTGISEAAEVYFGKSAGALDYSEAALLVGIANAPSKYNPYRNPEAAREKRNRVLFSLKECGFIDEEYYNIAISLPLNLKARKENKNEVLSWFSETVCFDAALALSTERGISMSVAKKLVETGGVHIYSTVSPRVQKTIESYFYDKNNLPRAVSGGLEFSFVVSDGKSGKLLGIVGSGREKAANKLLNYALVPNPPASTLKPLALYAPLIEEGKITWSTVFDDVPLEFKIGESGEALPYPKNSPDVYDGLICTKDALMQSKNTVAIKLYSLLGKEKIYKSLKENFGFDTLVKSEKSEGGKIISDLAPSPLALGQLTHGVSLRKMTEAYNCLANEGNLPKSYSFLAVFDKDMELLIETRSENKTVFSKETARIVTKMLQSVVDSGTAKRITLKEIVDTAGKTGTSGGDRDRWFIGYTPYYTAGIWCGYGKEKMSIGALEVSHVEIWDKIMTQLHSDIEKNGEPLGFSVEGLEKCAFCLDSGALVSDSCLLDPRGSRIAYGYFKRGTAPKKNCERHVICKYDALSEGVATENCEETNLVDIALIEILDRSFPVEITVTDAEYVYRPLSNDTTPGDSYDVPFFINMLCEGEYVGRGRRRKQFNSSCYIH